MTIKGGFILQPRIIEESDINCSPPHIREIWYYLLRNANHREIKRNGFSVRRGQLFRSYQDIRDALSWKVGYRTERYSEDQTKKAMKFLRDTQRITTTKALGGVLITICKYDYYQDKTNYESTNEITNESTNAAPMQHQCTTDNNKNVNNDKNKEIYNIYVSFISSFNKIRTSKFKATDKVSRQFNARIKEGFTVDQMLDALRNAMKVEYHINTGFKYLTPEFFTRSDKIELYTHGDGEIKEDPSKPRFMI